MLKNSLVYCDWEIPVNSLKNCYTCMTPFRAVGNSDGSDKIYYGKKKKNRKTNTPQKLEFGEHLKGQRRHLKSGDS